MGLRKYNKSEPLTHLIGVRVSAPAYEKLEALRKDTNCLTLGEFARRVLQKEEIIFYHKDATMDGVAAELAAIKKELNSIGVNINQVTRYFNSKALPNEKIFEALRILDDYRRITPQVEKLLTIISDIKWSPK
ncbi:MAG: plasmid mobilization relaxosome protein MobC [Cyclobacteriaceae bacterium]|nr:plasmid mobilization relaxosome protein MobC [Cyclobacteriaceae bacterium]